MDITQKQKRKIEKAINSLNEVMEELTASMPEAQYYLEDCANFYVMKGKTHDNNNEPIFDNVIYSLQLHGSSGGGW